MSIWMLLKVFGDICVLFGILGAFPTFFTYSYSLLWPAALCSAGVGIATALRGRGWNGLSRLAAVIPLTALLVAQSGPEMRILIPVIAYVMVVIIRGQFHLEYYAYRQYFVRSLILTGGLYVMLCIFSFLEGIGGDELRTIDAKVTLRYGIVYLLTGVILLRQLRLGLQEQSEGGRAQMTAVLVGTALVVLAFLAVEPILRQGATAVFKGILIALFSAILFVLDCFQSVLDQVEIQAMTEQVQAHRGDGDTPFMGPVVQYIQEATRYGPDETSYWWVWLVLIVLAVAMYLLLKSFRRTDGAAASAETVRSVAVQEPGRQDPRRSNRGKVRHYYREFLKQERKRGMKLRKDYTTEDILQRIFQDTDSAAAGELRQIYLLARYNEGSEITDEQVDAAKNALRRSRGGLSAR